MAGFVAVPANGAWAAEGGKGTVYGAGRVTCGEWQQQRSSGNKIKLFQLEAWVDGFLSAYNVASDGTDFIATKQDDPGIAYYAWIDNYCRQNPLNMVAEAAVALKNELIARALRETSGR
jgi:hypothetical protein